MWAGLKSVSMMLQRDIGNEQIPAQSAGFPVYLPVIKDVDAGEADIWHLHSWPVHTSLGVW